MRSRITVKAQKWLKTIFVPFDLFGTMPNNVKIADQLKSTEHYVVTHGKETCLHHDARQIRGIARILC